MPRTQQDKGNKVPPAGVWRKEWYRPEYCEHVLECGKAGMSMAEIAASLNVTRSVLTRWADTHEEFAHAITRACEHAQAWWETQGRQGAVGATPVNGPVWHANMKSRFPRDWGDKVTVEAGASFADALALAMKQAQSPAPVLIDATAETVEDAS